MSKRKNDGEGEPAAKKAKVDESVTTTMIVTLSHNPGSLSECLAVFKNLNLNMKKIASRPSNTTESQFEMEIDLEAKHDSEEVAQAKELLKQATGHTVRTLGGIPWFPRRPSDLDRIAHKTLDCGEELTSDHPGFQDAEYRTRRELITAIAKNYKHGVPIPRIEYTQAETDTWGVVYEKLTKLFPQHACKQFLTVFPLLEQHCGYSPTNIPQLEDISNYLRQCTGFSLRPVTGLLTPRDFLNGLAFRIFHSTQYIRHHSKPLYTPEPDVCHELLGHVPLFADPAFAEFSHEIGLASLGATDEEIEQLSTLYWFTVEFGLCREGDELKVYGAGILSSFGEMEYSMTDKCKVLPFDPSVTAFTKYPITTYQPTYFVAESFEDATSKMRQWTARMKRPFSVRYNAYTSSVEILDTNEKLCRLVHSITTDLTNLQKALEVHNAG